MQTTVRDIMSIEKLKSLQLVAGEGGLERTISKVGILDYEFSRTNNPFYTDTHWLPGEFVLTTFTYARDNLSIWQQAVKRLDKEKCSGIAIKNVFSMDLPQNIVYYANMHHFPVFLFTDNTLFFEDVIITVDRFRVFREEQDIMEQKLTALMLCQSDAAAIRSRALELNYALSNQYALAYFLLKTDNSIKLRLDIDYAARRLNHGDAIVKYGNGFFLIHSMGNGKKRETGNGILDVVSSMNVRKNYLVGVSDRQYSLSTFRKGLLQSYYAVIYSKISCREISEYQQIGMYKLLLPYNESELSEEYYDTFIAPLIAYDEANGSELLQTALVFEEKSGNVREISQLLSTHENTVRYRLKKISELMGKDAIDHDFGEQLSLAVKLYRIQLADVAPLPG